MSAPNNLDLHGNFLAFPLAELLTEIAAARLDGSLRLSHDGQKIIVYFSAGEIVFAVSNARASRLFDILLRENKISKKILTEMPNFTSDLEFAEALVEKKIFTRADIDALFVHQIEEVLRGALEWTAGVWVFSPLARIRQDIRFKINLSQLLAEHARRLSTERIFSRLRGAQESFLAAPPAAAGGVDLQPHEAFVLSRFGREPLKVEEIRIASGLPESAVLQALYALWLGGFLIPQNRNAAFTENKISEILSARFTLKKEAVQAPSVKIETPEEIAKAAEEKSEAVREAAGLSLEAYLAKVENALTLYDTLEIAVSAPTEEIKHAYFALAKQFHPDRFYKKTDAALHARIQNAFSQIAQAYETLKNKETRTSYDFKMRKEAAQREKMREEGITSEEAAQHKQTDLATENFDHGFALLEAENYGEAVPFLARAAHLSPATARFHAFFGKALAADARHRHKAEGELQTAVRLEPGNADFRLMLARFFIQYNLPKRAEGELSRLLEISPNHREAAALLDSLLDKKLN